MSAAAAPASASAAAAPVSASASGVKRAREPTEAELASQALLARLFAPEASGVLNRAQAIMAKQAPAAASGSPQKKAKHEGETSGPNSNPFVAAMDKAAAAARGPSARTANGAASLASSGTPVLDLFYHLARGYSRTDTHVALTAAWKESPERALQVLCHARDCHGEGKGERLVVYHALMWLRQHKPRTYLANLLTFLSHGYFKDLIHIVDLVDQGAARPGYVEPEDAQPQQQQQQRGGRGRKGRGGRGAPVQASKKKSEKEKKQERPASMDVSGSILAADKAAKPVRGLGNSQLELRIYAEFLKADHLNLKKWRQAKKAWKAHMSKEGKEPGQPKNEDDKEKAPAAAAPSASSPAASATSWFDDDAELVTDDIVEWEDVSVAEAREGVDRVSLAQPGASPAAAAPGAAAASDVPQEPSKTCFISLAAKYAPTERHHFGGQAKALAKILFGGDSAQKQGGAGFESKAHMQACMKRYRTLLSTLRAHLCITERLACANRWKDINFGSVPSKCHQLMKKAFQKHEPERYGAYLAGLKRGVGKINVAGLDGPHELVKFYLDRQYISEEYPGAGVNETVEAAWRGMVDKVKESGTFNNAVAVVDVSGSMSGTPMIVAIALGLMIQELTTGPFAGRVLTFHERPSWHQVQGETLREKVACLARADWGGSTNFSATFDLMLDVAVQHRLPQSALPQTLFCFSDMQFDEAAGGGGWMETNHESLKRKWRAAGYELPGIVYWNLNGKLNKDVPIRCDQAGCALMSGFSQSLLNVFLRAPIVADPVGLAAVLPRAEGQEGDAMEDVEGAVDPAANPLHPISIMMDSIGGYTVVVEESER